MRKHLYFICPTDHLETVIGNNFQQENYYLTSLGNSVTFNPTLIEEVNSLLESKRITEITFVLSDNNRFILDALKIQSFNDVRGLKNFYDIISEQKNHKEVLWQKFNVRIPIISYYLNLKIKELQLQLNNWLTDSVKVNAKIYNRQQNTFNEIHADLLHLEHHSLN